MKNLFVVALLSLFIAVSCAGGYSFTGASINPETKTFHVENFLNRASIVQPVLASELTYSMINKIRSGTNLQETQYDADAVFSGTITGYHVTPVAISSNDQAAKNRLTITVKVSYRNKQDRKANFDTSFSRYKEYDSSLSLSNVEEELIREINEELVDDIFTKAFVNW
ncbi:MAG: LptE family protein [Bacteroidales bacterium]|nr:LptE family protein [Bacteroidales bacterium]